MFAAEWRLIDEGYGQLGLGFFRPHGRQKRR
jgi:hypothetical protein